MIAAQCLGIRKKIEELQRVRAISKEIQGFTDRQNKLAELVDRVSKAISAKQLFHSEKIGPVPAALGIVQLQDKVNNLQGSFMASPISILEPNSLKQIIQGINTACDEMESNLTESWSTYKIGNLINLNPELLDILSKIPGFSENVKKVLGKIKELEQHNVSYPTTRQEVEDFRASASALADAWNKLDSQNIPPEVWNFLKNAVAPGGASMNTITAEVLNWLRDHMVEGSFRVKLSS